ncbi:MAG: hypothetical protein AABW61_01150 [Candidatus Aenigmatarchaeota archaeon]|jgi:hypothetical protein
MISFLKNNDKKTTKKELVIRLIEKLEQSNLGNYEKLEDIKLELQEGIPLSLQKKKYLKEIIEELKGKKST